MFCAYDIASRLASKQRALSLFNEHISHSEHLHNHREEREKFGCAVGRVLVEIQKYHKDSLPSDAVPDADVVAKPFLSTRMHPNLERCIGGLSKVLPYSAEGLSLALYYMDRLQRLYDDVVNCWTLDRMFATAVVVASKFAYDEVYPNTYYASRLGLSIYELNRLELAFLSLLEFKMAPDRQRWMKLHCMIAQIAFEESSGNGNRGSCPLLELPVAKCSKRISFGSDLTTSTTDTPVSPSPVTPMISSVETPRSARGKSIAPISITIMSPESSSSSPKRVVDAVSTHGKRHSQNTIDEKPHRHRHRHHHRDKKSSSVTDTS